MTAKATAPAPKQPITPAKTTSAPLKVVAPPAKKNTPAAAKPAATDGVDTAKKRTVTLAPAPAKTAPAPAPAKTAPATTAVATSDKLANGAETLAVQNDLIALGYGAMLGTSGADGKMGKNTLKAMEKFRDDRKLPANASQKTIARTLRVVAEAKGKDNKGGATTAPMRAPVLAGNKLVFSMSGVNYAYPITRPKGLPEDVVPTSIHVNSFSPQGGKIRVTFENPNEVGGATFYECIYTLTFSNGGKKATLATNGNFNNQAITQPRTFSGHMTMDNDGKVSVGFGKNKATFTTFELSKEMQDQGRIDRWGGGGSVPRYATSKDWDAAKPTPQAPEVTVENGTITIKYKLYDKVTGDELLIIHSGMPEPKLGSAGWPASYEQKS